MKKEFLGRGWAFPLAVDPSTGAIATSAYEDNIRQSMTLILGTRPGERQMRPDFGCKIHDLVYTPNTAANASLIAYHVETALEQFEQRIDVIDVAAQPQAGGRVAVSVKYRVKSTLVEQVLDVDLQTGG